MTIQKLRNKIDKTMNVIRYAEILPPKEGIMLLTNQKYITGSDYSDLFLSQTVCQRHLNVHPDWTICDMCRDEIEEQECRWGHENNLYN